MDTKEVKALLKAEIKKYSEAAISANAHGQRQHYLFCNAIARTLESAQDKITSIEASFIERLDREAAENLRTTEEG